MDADTTSDDRGHGGEVPCVDCGCDLIRDPDLPGGEQRCDTDKAHHHKLCGEDCPVICEACREHHFAEDRCDQREVAEALLKFVAITVDLVLVVTRPDWLVSAVEAAKRMLGGCKVCGELKCDHE